MRRIFKVMGGTAMFHQESADAAHFEEVILQSLRHILRHQDAARFLD